MLVFHSAMRAISLKCLRATQPPSDWQKKPRDMELGSKLPDVHWTGLNSSRLPLLFLTAAICPRQAPTASYVPCAAFNGLKSSTDDDGLKSSTDDVNTARTPQCKHPSMPCLMGHAHHAEALAQALARRVWPLVRQRNHRRHHHLSHSHLTVGVSPPM